MLLMFFLMALVGAQAQTDLLNDSDAIFEGFCRGKVLASENLIPEGAKAQSQSTRKRRLSIVDFIQYCGDLSMQSASFVANAIWGVFEAEALNYEEGDD